MSGNNIKITSSHLINLIKTWLFGFLFAEVLFFSKSIGLKLGEFITKSNLETVAVTVGLIYLLVIVAYLIYREVHWEVFKIVGSKRIDLLFIFGVGVISSYFLGGVGSEFYKKAVSILSVNQLFVALSVPLFVYFSFLLHGFRTWLRDKRENKKSFFISDNEQRARSGDLLGFSEIAEKFAERVMNLGSSDSLVFGVDAPWGVGKSSFVNFCREYWKEKYGRQIVVYVFNPLKYEDRENLLEKFIDGLIKEIQKNLFMPEIKPVISKYAQMIRSIKGSILGFFDFEITNGGYTVDDAFNDLESTLVGIDQKIIVIIDDLDRLNLSAVKDLLFTVKKSFTLPNISYVLCYDAENINALEEKKPDFEKVTEFLEKFINVKVGLYLSSSKLNEYVSTNLEKSLSGNSQTDPILVSKAIGGLKDIFKSSDYHSYVPFIGDIRKLKRLINTVLLLDLEKTDFDNSDINNYDLIHLLLIYINYPNIFRKIYNSETGGKKGFFSLVAQYEDGYPKDSQRSQSSRDSDYKNSIKYTDFIKASSLTESQKFLINKVFEVNQRLDNSNAGNVSAELRASLACFNGDIWSSGNRNLEDYLNLIVSSSKPIKTDQYKFYLNQKDRLLKGVSVEEILKNEAFSYKQTEASQKQLWKVIINSAYEFNEQVGDQLISYLTNNITDYSHFEHEEAGLGLRHDLSFYLVKMLDQAGWVDENGEHKSNFDKNISGITDWIFGEGKHSNQGILSILSEEKRGILGLYDLLAFRLYCSADRGGDVFNLTNALSKHSDPKAPTEGSTKTIALEEMRIVSQKVYKIFKEQYINKKRNIFELAETLALSDLAGKYKVFVQEKIKSGQIKDAKEMIGNIKSKIKGFIVYQMGSSSTEFGIACGYYDPIGKEDKHDISIKVNDYLFAVCFNPGKKKDNPKNYEHFLDYLLASFASVFESVKGRSYIPHINDFIKVLNKERLYKYWKTNSARIRSLGFESKNKTVFTPNYRASYKEDLPDVYKVLDDFVKEWESPKPPEAVEQKLIA
ncbi:KAP family NTPase [Patescibacteria group bacterium]|nr:KAP family NTPase [Patescibacteria group bacterium]